MGGKAAGLGMELGGGGGGGGARFPRGFWVVLQPAVVIDDCSL